MPLPENLFFNRHGLSEGNVANGLSRKGDHTAFENDEFTSRSSSKWRLVPEGVRQVQAAHLWYKKNCANMVFGRNIASTYLRAMESAGIIDPDAVWYLEYDLRERDRGAMDVISQVEAKKHYPHIFKALEIDPLRAGFPDGGESLLQMRPRIRGVLGTLARECSKMNVRIECHGEVMWVFRMLLERMTPEEFERLDRSQNPFDRIHNAQILHYTRIDPFTGDPAPYYNWMRSICPWDMSLSSNEWQPIIRPKYTGAQLLTLVENTPRLVG